MQRRTSTATTGYKSCVATVPNTGPVRRGASKRNAFRRGVGRSCPTMKGWRRSMISCLKDNNSHFVAFPTAAPDRLRYEGTGFGLPPLSTNSRPVRRGDSNRNTIQGTSALEGTQLGEQRASGRRRHRGSKTLHRGRLGAGGSCIGVRVQAARCPRSFDPLLQSIPRPWEVTEYRNGIWRYHAPRGRLSGTSQGFSPAVSHA